MSKGGRTKRDGVSVDGPWVPLPCAFFASRACAELSPHAAKMLMFFLGQLKAGGYGNGRLDAGEARLRAFGWNSPTTAHAAIKELVVADLVVCTRKGAKGRLALYGLTLMPMHCDHSVLDCGPGAWTVADWRANTNAAAAPTEERPAVHRSARQNEADKKRSRTPRGGSESRGCTTAAEVNQARNPARSPAAVVHAAIPTLNALPPRKSPSRTPSVRQLEPLLLCSQPAVVAA